MSIQFKGAPPTQEEVERIRLLLSTYQDGTGQLVVKGIDGTLPNWRDFERSVALAFKGVAQESKSIFDVIIPTSATSLAIGISCKMRSELRQVSKKGVIYVEVSNAAGDFWSAVKRVGINTTLEMGGNPAEAGRAILELVESWHISQHSYVDLHKSYYLVLQYDTKKLHYQLFQLPLQLPDPSTLIWEVRYGKAKGKESSGSLIGRKGGRAVVEWYADSGGQLKFYPKVEESVWHSDIFQLEPLPANDAGYGVLQKAKVYFPNQWETVGFYEEY